jgi:hypothetical protein
MTTWSPHPLTLPAARAEAGCVRDLVELGWVAAAGNGLLGVPARPAQWAAEQLKDAALHVLRVEEAALRSGATLRRVSPEQVRFVGSRPVWTDPGAVRRQEGRRWTAEDEFRLAFVEPLLRAALELPAAGRAASLREASRRLPKATWFNGTARGEIHLRGWRRRGAMDAVERLRAVVEGLNPSPRWSPWQCYGTAREDGLLRILLKEAVRVRRPSMVYLFGDATGQFGRTIAREGADCVSFEAAERNVAACYLHERALNGTRLLPLVGRLEEGRSIAPGAPRAGLVVLLRTGLERLTPDVVATLLRLGERVLLEYDPSVARGPVSEVLAAFRPWLAVEEVAEVSGDGRRLCTLAAG